MHGHHSLPLSIHACMLVHMFPHTNVSNLIIPCGPCRSITPTNSSQSRSQVNSTISGPIPHMGQGNYKLCMLPHHATYTHMHVRAHLKTHPLSFKPPCTCSPFHLPLIPSPSLSACHSLSLAWCKIALKRAATVLRNSVIYWQFPPQVSGILYLNMSAATLNKTVLSIYISLPQTGLCHTAHGTQ